MMEEHRSQESDDNKPIIASPVETGDRFRRNEGTILFVGNLPFQTPWQNVKDHFREAGKVRYTDLIADRTGRPKGSALVTMMTVEDAESAIEMFNETDFEGRRLIVRKFDDGPRPPLVQRNMMPPYGANNNNNGGGNNNMMGNNNNNNANNMNNRRGGYGGGAVQAGNNGNFGGGGYRPFNGGVNPNNGPMGGGGGGAYGRPGGFARPYGPDGAGAPMGSVPIQHDMPSAGDQLPKPRSQQLPEAGRRLLVTNLPYDCNNTALRETFQQVGVVDRAEVLFTHGQSRGMGVVVMRTEEDARVAIAEFDGIEMANRAMSVRLDNKP